MGLSPFSEFSTNNLCSKFIRWGLTSDKTLRRQYCVVFGVCIELMLSDLSQARHNNWGRTLRQPISQDFDIWEIAQFESFGWRRYKFAKISVYYVVEGQTTFWTHLFWPAAPLSSQEPFHKISSLILRARFYRWDGKNYNTKVYKKTIPVYNFILYGKRNRDIWRIEVTQ